MSFIYKSQVYNIAKEHVWIGLIVFCLAIMSIFLPKLYGYVSEVEAVNFGSATSLISVPGDPADEDAPYAGQIDLLYISDTYYMAFSSSTGNVDNDYVIYFSTSSDGNSWSSPVTVSSSVKGTETWNLQYNENGSYFGIVYYASSTALTFTTSSDGASWPNDINIRGGAGTMGIGPYLAFAPSSDLVVVVAGDGGKNVFEIRTSTNGSNISWSSSTIAHNSGVDAELNAIGVGISGTSGNEIIHVMYGFDDDCETNPPYHKIIYASSTDLGTTWVTSTVINLVGSDIEALMSHMSFGLDDNGQPGFLYYNTTTSTEDSEDGPYNVTSTVIYGKRASGGSWTTSSIDTASFTYATGTSYTELEFFNTDDPIIGYLGNSYYPMFAVNTSTFNTTTVASEAINETGKIAIAYDTTLEEIGYAYVSGGQLKFATSSLATLVTPYAGNLESISSDAKTKLLWIDDTYYLAFSSSTSDGSYDVFLTTSTNGEAGNWSQPATVYEEVYVSDGSNGFFAFDYNTSSAYFGLAAFATGTDRIDFTTSSNGSTWSSTTTVRDGDSSNNTIIRRLFLKFSDSEDYALIGHMAKINTEYYYSVATSTNGSSWATSSIQRHPYSDAEPSFTGIGISGSGGSRVLHIAYQYASSTYDIIYASSTNNGITWTTTTAALPNTSAIAPLTDITAFSVDDNGLAGLYYFDVTDFGAPTNVTGTPIYAKRSVGGSWTTSSLGTVAFNLSGPPEPADLFFFNTDDPIVLYMGDSFYPYYGVNTSTSFTTSSLSATALGVSSELSGAYDVTNEILGVSWINNSGQLTFTTTSLPTPAAGNTVPTATAITPSQTTASIVTLTTTVADTDSDATTLVLEYSTDNSTWSSSTLATVTDTEGQGGVTTSTGQISGIDTDNDGSVDLTIQWDIETDLANTDDTTVWFRVIPNDGTASGSTVTSASSFAIDTKDPTVPSAVAVNTTSTQSIIFTLPSTTSTDTNFSEYKIYYKAGASGVTESDTAFTSSSDANLGNSNFNGATTTTVSGFATNTQYVFNIWAYDSWAYSTSSASELAAYTLTTVPTSVSATANSQTQITVSYSGNGTQYYTENTTASTNSGWITDTSYAFTGLSCGTSYTFRVKARNGNNVETAWASSVNASTSNCPTGGGGSASPPPAPSAAAPVTQSLSLPANSSHTVSVGNSSHTVSVGTPSNGQISITIQSDPVTLTLAESEEALVDTDNDNVNDLYVKVNSLEPQVELTITAIQDLEFSINQALSTTDSRQVTLYFNSPQATQMAISDTSDFINVGFEDYTATKDWTLTADNGDKTVYVKFRTNSGNTKIVSDTITLTNQATGDCSLTLKQPYKHTQSPAVYYITSECTKRPFNRSDVYFTYFTSWSDVQLTTQAKLDAVADDELDFMPWGPLYDPQYGALVKIVKDPKVYLLLNTERYWITNAGVFESLNYAWAWIEDIATDLLDKYTLGSEINYTDHHPNYTLIKYADSPKVYRLEPDGEEQVKRWIPDEPTFESLGYRWDRIVVIEDSEIYGDGSDLE